MSLLITPISLRCAARQDTLLAVGPLLVLTLPGAPERRPEVAGVREAAQQLLAASASVDGSSNGEEQC